MKQTLEKLWNDYLADECATITFALRTFHDCNAIISRIHRIHFMTKGYFIASRRDVEAPSPTTPLPIFFPFFQQQNTQRTRALLTGARFLCII